MDTFPSTALLHSSAEMPYWFVSFPSGPTAEEKNTTWSNLVSKTQSLLPSPASRLEIPKLKVGTLDSLLALSDDMLKINALIESTVLKLKRQFLELSRLDTAATGDTGGLTVDGRTVHEFLTQFYWEEAKYPSNRPLRETVEKIQETVARIDDDMKARLRQTAQQSYATLLHRGVCRSKWENTIMSRVL